MSKITDRYNKTFAKFDFTPNKNFSYMSLKELYNGETGNNKYIVLGIYINHKSKYGDSPVAVTDSCYVNLPKHMLGVVKEMLEDEDAITAINNKELGFEVYKYETKGVTGYSVKWVDM